MTELKRDNENLNQKSILENPDLKKFPFAVSEDYFSSLEDVLKSRISQEEVESKRFIIRRSLKAYLSLAASFLLIFGVGWGVLKVTTNKQKLQNPIAVVDNHVYDYGGGEYIDSLDFYISSQEMKEAINSEDALFTATDENLNNISDEKNSEVVDEYIQSMPSSYTHLIAGIIYEEHR